MSRPVKHQFEFHPFANLFPMMGKEEFEQFKKDIAQNGLSEPILLYEGKILDGRNRFKACTETGTELKIEQWKPSMGSALTYVVSRNLHRRHLTPAQRAMIGTKLKPLFEAEAKERQRAGGRAAHGLQSRLPEAQKGQARDLAARAVGVAPRMITDAERIKRDGISEIELQVLAGKMSIGRGVKLSSLPKEAQRKFIEQMAQANPDLITEFARTIGRKRSEERDKANERDWELLAQLYPDITDRYKLFPCEIVGGMKKIEDGTADYVITDPPYQKADLNVYRQLGEFCEAKLKDGGSLLCMVGQMYFCEILNVLAEHLNYHWTIAYLLEGNARSLVRVRKIQQAYKPILWFVKGKYKGHVVSDICRSPNGERDKQYHKWGQSLAGMIDLCDQHIQPGQLVVDPFCGAGTTGIAALNAGALFLGFDKDKESIAKTKVRINEWYKENGS